MQKVGKLTPNQIPTHCWEVISVDTIGELLESKGYNAILVTVDRLSKHIHAVPTVTTVDSTGVAHCRCHNPHRVVSHVTPVTLL